MGLMMEKVRCKESDDETESLHRQQRQQAFVLRVQDWLFRPPQRALSNIEIHAFLLMTACMDASEASAINIGGLHCYARSHPRRRIFMAMCACNTLPYHVLEDGGDFILVVNLDLAHQLGSHFITLHGRGDALLYLCSLAQPCNNAHILAFVRAFFTRRQSQHALWHVFMQPLQSTHSKACGMYAILFCLHFSTKQMHRQCLVFSNQHVNDNLAVNYIMKYLLANKC